MLPLLHDEVIACANPKLWFISHSEGILTDLVSLEFVIFDDTGSQVYPGSGRQAVDIAAACPAGDKLGTGRYVAKWTVPSSGSGEWKIRWFWKIEATDAEQYVDERFEVLAPATVALPGNPYAFVASLRAEGLALADYADKWVYERILTASRLIDRLTGQEFGARYTTVRADGRDTYNIRLRVPIVAIETISVGVTVQSAVNLVVYNRHVDSGLVAPDDRGNPIVYNARKWADGRLNVGAAGVFGYTDPPGPKGSIPELLRRACQLLVIRDVDALTLREERLAKQTEGLIVEDKTRDQSQRIAGIGPGGKGGAHGWLTGDLEIDTILERFMAPIAIGGS